MQMSKYDFSLDMESDNSNSLILRNILPHSRVLEMGPSYGRMTKYLKEVLECYICIVEKDFAAGISAKQYADNFFIGENDFHIIGYDGDECNGNIDKNMWHYQLQSDEKFDYIIFADVLEHVYDPWTALKNAATLLKNDGSIWISVPNSFHNAVLIDLLCKDNFQYRPIGLLDDSHIRFFTRTTLLQMVANSGLTIHQVLDPKNSVENTEIGTSYQDITDSSLEEFLKNRPDGEVYQFIWELKKS